MLNALRVTVTDSKNWKRTSKRKSGANTILRTFECKAFPFQLIAEVEENVLTGVISVELCCD